jgi:oxygen-independent coproporphyrinogen III oxidase
VTWTDWLQRGAFQSYSYAYPHKTAYRPFDPAPALTDVWRDQSQQGLFLYLHVPYCTQRCGFCNLFTRAERPDGPLGQRYVDAVRRQADAVQNALPDATFHRLAIGGGTPTFLDLDSLGAILDLPGGAMGVKTGSVPTSCESSPETLTLDKVALLAQYGIERLSIGVQSFLPDETRSLGRIQGAKQVDDALCWIRDSTIPLLNIDLIYGIRGQTTQTWRDSLLRALSYEPEELYLYPLYVRPLTGLDRQNKAWDSNMSSLYQVGRDLLLERGYSQVSMRMFRSPSASAAEGPTYSCTQDGMIGLGAGARSYTRSLHYSTEYAVGRSGVSAILDDYLQAPASRWASVSYGFELDSEDQRRRMAILGILSHEGLAFDTYEGRFKAHPMQDLPQLQQLIQAGLAQNDGQRLSLSSDGLALSDAIGPWLYSERVNRLSAAYELQ